MRRPCNLVQVVTGWPSLAALETWAWNVQPPAPSGKCFQTTAVALIGKYPACPLRLVEGECSYFQTMHGRIDWSLNSISRAVFPEECPTGTESPGTSAAGSRLRLTSTPVLDAFGAPLVWLGWELSTSVRETGCHCRSCAMRTRGQKRGRRVAVSPRLTTWALSQRVIGPPQLTPNGVA